MGLALYLSACLLINLFSCLSGGGVAADRCTVCCMEYKRVNQTDRQRQGEKQKRDRNRERQKQTNIEAERQRETGREGGRKAGRQADRQRHQRKLTETFV